MLSYQEFGSAKIFLENWSCQEFLWAILCERKYECGLLASKPADFPMETNHKLALSTRKAMEDPTKHRRLVRRLIYLTITRPELCYTVHILSQFMREPKDKHLEAAKRVLRYLRATLDKNSSQDRFRSSILCMLWFGLESISNYMTLPN